MYDKIRSEIKRDFYMASNAFFDTYARLLTPPAFVVYHCLSRMANNNTQDCYPSQKKIGEMCHLSPPTVVRCIKELETAKLVRVEKEDFLGPAGQVAWKFNVYTLLQPPLPEITTSKESDHPNDFKSPPQNEPQNTPGNHSNSESDHPKSFNINNTSKKYSEEEENKEPPIVPQTVDEIEKKAEEYPQGFRLMWDLYPHDRRGAKGKAYEIWKKRRLEKYYQVICLRIQAAVTLLWKNREPQFIPLSTTYLNQGYWQTEVSGEDEWLKENFYDEAIEAIAAFKEKNERIAV